MKVKELNRLAIEFLQPDEKFRFSHERINRILDLDPESHYEMSLREVAKQLQKDLTDITVEAIPYVYGYLGLMAVDKEHPAYRKAQKFLQKLEEIKSK